MTNKRGLTARFMVLEGCFWVVIFFIEGLFAALLADFGYSEGFIGLAIMSTGIACLAVQPVSGFLGDRFGKLRLMFVLAMAVAALLYPLLFVFYKSKLAVILYSVVCGSLIKAAMGLLDSWIGKLSASYPELDYGRVRSVGSICYAVAAVGLGQIFSRFGNAVSVWFLLGLCLLSIIVALGIPNPQIGVGKGSEERPSLREAAGVLAHNREFLMFLGVSMLLSITSQGMFYFLSLLIGELGGGMDAVGMSYFVMAAAEFLVVANYTRISRRFGIGATLTVGMFFYGVKCFLLSMCTSVTGVYLVVLLQTVSYAFVMPGTVAQLQKVVGPRYLSSALLIYNTGFTSVIQIIFSPIYGSVAERLGMRAMFSLISLPAFAASALFGLHLWRNRQRARSG